jgi:hypothetical protein
MDEGRFIEFIYFTVDPPPANSAMLAGGQNRMKNKISSKVAYKSKDIANDFF